MKVVCAVPIEAELGECPFWSARDACLYWIDMYLPAIYRHRPSDGANERLPLPKVAHVGGFIPRECGGFVLGVPDGLVFYDPASSAMTPFADPRDGLDGVFYNDAKADRQGRLWIDTYHVSEKEPLAALYRIDPNGRATTVVGPGCRQRAGFCTGRTGPLSRRQQRR